MVRSIVVRAVPDGLLADRLRDLLSAMLAEFPWRVEIEDWTGRTYALGGRQPHWYGNLPLRITIKTAAAGRDLLGLNALRFLERYLDEEVDFDQNLYLLPEIRNYAKLGLKPWQILVSRLQSRVMQDPARAERSVRSHYDIDQRCFYYLDRVFQSYSCALWEHPERLSLDDVLTVGRGEGDTFDSLEKAQWNKFRHSADYLAPAPGESVLDVGCGYPGFMKFLLDRFPGCKVTGWTHSQNHFGEGLEILRPYDSANYHLKLGDYRMDRDVYDHVHSAGMICHVGPEGRNSGLRNYCREISRRIRYGGRYVHHCMMYPHTDRPLFDEVAPQFIRKYVWPGFWYYTLGEHVRALEESGFHVARVLNISPHYAKTGLAWRERLKAQKQTFVEHASEATYRAWDFYLTGATTAFLNRNIHVMRILAERVDAERPSVVLSDPARAVCARLGLSL